MTNTAVLCRCLLGIVISIGLTSEGSAHFQSLTRSTRLTLVTMNSTVTIDVIELQSISPTAIPNASSTKDFFQPSDAHSIGREGVVLSNTPAHASLTPSEEEILMSNLQLTMTILQPSLVNFFGSFTSGIITVGLPIIASSTSLQRSLYLWPSSVYSLTSGATLLIAGSAADIIGARRVEVFGIFLLGIFIVACGFSQTGIQLVVFRALQGIALAMHIPASVSIIASAVPAGRARNIGFSCLGLSQPLGFSFGIVLGGIMIERIGWRSGFYLSGAAILTAAVVSWFTLPKAKAGAENLTLEDVLKKLRKEVDWIGGTIAGSGLALLSYVLAYVPSSSQLFADSKSNMLKDGECRPGLNPICNNGCNACSQPPFAHRIPCLDAISRAQRIIRSGP